MKLTCGKLKEYLSKCKDDSVEIDLNFLLSFQDFKKDFDNYIKLYNQKLRTPLEDRKKMIITYGFPENASCYNCNSFKEEGSGLFSYYRCNRNGNLPSTLICRHYN